MTPDERGWSREWESCNVALYFCITPKMWSKQLQENLRQLCIHKTNESSRRKKYHELGKIYSVFTMACTVYHRDLSDL